MGMMDGNSISLMSYILYLPSRINFNSSGGEITKDCKFASFMSATSLSTCRFFSVMVVSNIATLLKMPHKLSYLIYNPIYILNNFNYFFS